jgi:DNA-binding FadR family transcriptional regulator
MMIGSASTLHRRVAAGLGGRIVRGEIGEGETLPNEAALGAELGVSRTVVREAVKVLAARRLLEVRPKTGTRVRPRREWNMLDPEVLEWQFSGEAAPAALQDLLEVRRVIEPAAARLAAERARPEELRELERAWDGMVEATGRAGSSVDPDLRFHLGVLAATHNAFMRSFGWLIQAVLRSSFRLTSADRAAYLRSVEQHRKVLGAIRGGDASRAEVSMRELLESTAEDVRRALGLPRRGDRASGDGRRAGARSAPATARRHGRRGR